MPRAPDFWWRRRTRQAMRLLRSACSTDTIAVRRMEQPGVSVGVPVICVGNLVLGGAGKTPTAIEVADVCRELGLRPGFLTRGYRRQPSAVPSSSPSVVHTARQVGDEALLLSLHRADRGGRRPTEPARSSSSAWASIVIVMDDGFQNPRSSRIWPLVVVDAGRAVSATASSSPPARSGRRSSIRCGSADALVVLGEGIGRHGRAHGGPRRPADTPRRTPSPSAAAG